MKTILLFLLFSFKLLTPETEYPLVSIDGIRYRLNPDHTVDLDLSSLKNVIYAMRENINFLFRAAEQFENEQKFDKSIVLLKSILAADCGIDLNKYGCEVYKKKAASSISYFTLKYGNEFAKKNDFSNISFSKQNQVFRLKDGLFRIQIDFKEPVSFKDFYSVKKTKNGMRRTYKAERSEKSQIVMESFQNWTKMNHVEYAYLWASRLDIEKFISEKNVIHNQDEKYCSLFSGSIGLQKANKYYFFSCLKNQTGVLYISDSVNLLVDLQLR